MPVTSLWVDCRVESVDDGAISLGREGRPHDGGRDRAPPRAPRPWDGRATTLALPLAVGRGGRPRDGGDGNRRSPSSAISALGRPRGDAGPPLASGKGGEAARRRRRRSAGPFGHLGLGAAAQRHRPSSSPWDGRGGRATAAAAISGPPPWPPRPKGGRAMTLALPSPVGREGRPSVGGGGDRRAPPATSALGRPRDDAGPPHARWTGWEAARRRRRQSAVPPSATSALGRPRDDAGRPLAVWEGGEPARRRRRQSAAPLGHLDLGADPRRR